MPNVYQLTISGNAAGQFMQTILHFRLSEAGTNTPFSWARHCIDEFVSNLQADFVAPLCQEYNMTSYRCRRVTGGGGPTAIKTLGPGVVVGGRAGTLGETALACVIDFPAVVNAKNVTGKIFMAPINGDDITDNLFATTLTNDVATFGGDLLTPITMASGFGTMTYTIFNRAHGVDGLPLGSYVSPVPGTQRRRLHPI